MRGTGDEGTTPGHAAASKGGTVWCHRGAAQSIGPTTINRSPKLTCFAKLLHCSCSIAFHTQSKDPRSLACTFCALDMFCRRGVLSTFPPSRPLQITVRYRGGGESQKRHFVDQTHQCPSRHRPSMAVLLFDIYRCERAQSRTVRAFEVRSAKAMQASFGNATGQVNYKFKCSKRGRSNLPCSPPEYKHANSTGQFPRGSHGFAPG